MRPVRNVFQKLSRTEQRREEVVAYLCLRTYVVLYSIWKLLGQINYKRALSFAHTILREILFKSINEMRSHNAKCKLDNVITYTYLPQKPCKSCWLKEQSSKAFTLDLFHGLKLILTQEFGVFRNLFSKLLICELESQPPALLTAGSPSLLFKLSMW